MGFSRSLLSLFGRKAAPPARLPTTWLFVLEAAGEPSSGETERGSTETLAADDDELMLNVLRCHLTY